MFSKVKIVPELDNPTPARIHRPSGTLFINMSTWNNFNDDEKRIILNHEAGHYRLQTRNESLADTYSLMKNAGKFKESLRKSVTILQKANINDASRMLDNILNILLYDYMKFGNKKALKKYKQLSMENTGTNIGTMNIQDYLAIQKSIFLEEKGIKNFDDLMKIEQDELITEFINLPEIEIILRSLNLIDDEYSNFDYSSLIEVGSNLIGGLFASQKAKSDAEAEKAKARAEAVRLAALNTPPEKQGLGTYAIVGIGVGGLLVIATALYFLLK